LTTSDTVDGPRSQSTSMGRNSASVKVGDGLRAISIKELIDCLQK
jgi:hypothetical protein